MLTEADLSPYIDRSKRREILQGITGFSVAEEVAQWRIDAYSSDAAYPSLPRDLWGVVTLLVPFPDENGKTEWVAVVANAVSVFVHGEEAVPDLMNVDYVGMNDRQEQQYSGYCQAFAAYLGMFQQKVEARLATLKMHVKEIKVVLPGYYRDNVTRIEAKRLAAADPFVRELERTIETDKALASTLNLRVRGLYARTQQVSRDLSRRVLEFQTGGLTGFGSGGGRGEPTPAPRPGRGARFLPKI